MSCHHGVTSMYTIYAYHVVREVTISNYFTFETLVKTYMYCIVATGYKITRSNWDNMILCNPPKYSKGIRCPRIKRMCPITEILQRKIKHHSLNCGGHNCVSCKQPSSSRWYHFTIYIYILLKLFLPFLMFIFVEKKNKRNLLTCSHRLIWKVFFIFTSSLFFIHLICFDNPPRK